MVSFAGTSHSTARPLVSVVIPTRNRAADFLHRSMRSVLNQTWQDLELIVVDDNSEDGTAQVVRAIDDPRIRYLFRRNACGASAARNAGVAVARGDFVAFLDDDDEWMPFKLEKQMRVFERNPSLGFVYSGWAWVSASSGQPGLVRIPDREGLIAGMPRWAFNVAVDFVARREICLRFPFPEGVSHMENCHVLVELSQRFGFGYVTEPTVLCSAHNGTRVSDSAATRAKGIEHFLSQHGSYVRRYPKIWARYNLSLGALYLGYLGQKRASRTHFRTAIRSAPLQGKAWAYLLTSLLPDFALHKLFSFR